MQMGNWHNQDDVPHFIHKLFYTYIEHSFR